jgi:hypothetical protein
LVIYGGFNMKCPSFSGTGRASEATALTAS